MVIAWLATANGDPAVLPVPPKPFVPTSDRSLGSAIAPGASVIYTRAGAVHEDMQGRGLGTALLMYAIRRCAAIAEQMDAAAMLLPPPPRCRGEALWGFKVMQGVTVMRQDIQHCAKGSGGSAGLLPNIKAHVVPKNVAAREGRAEP